jgi:hypothetical protein
MSLDVYHGLGLPAIRLIQLIQRTEPPTNHFNTSILDLSFLTTKTDQSSKTLIHLLLQGDQLSLSPLLILLNTAFLRY